MKNKNYDGTVREAGNKSSAVKVSFSQKYNIIPKILCFVAAFVMWIYVMQTESPEFQDVIASVPVVIENKAGLQSTSGLSVYGNTQNMVNVNLKGKKSAIDKLSAEDLYAYVDVSQIKESGLHALAVHVNAPDGISVVTPEPSTISIYADETDVKSLSVSGKLENFVLTSPYELGEIKLEYDSITVTGPKNKLQSLSGAQVAINMQDKTSSFVSKCPISLVDINGEKIDMTYLTPSATELNVTVPIYVSKEIPVVTSFKYGLFNSNAVRVTVNPSTITVKGDESKFSDVSSIIDEIVIDEKAITDSTYTMDVMVKASNDVIIADTDKEVKVTVELDPSLKTKQFTISNIETKGAPTDLEYEVLDKTATVTLRGYAKDLSEIKTSDISLVVDLSGFDTDSKGTISIVAGVDIDAELSNTVFEVGSYPIQIKIE